MQVERMQALTRQLIEAMEQDQSALVGTLLAERQQLLARLSGVTPPERAALLESDQALLRAAQQIQERIARDLAATRRPQPGVRLPYACAAPAASYVDHWS